MTLPSQQNCQQLQPQQQAFELLAKVQNKRYHNTPNKVQNSYSIRELNRASTSLSADATNFSAGPCGCHQCGVRLPDSHRRQALESSTQSCTGEFLEDKERWEWTTLTGYDEVLGNRPERREALH